MTFGTRAAARRTGAARAASLGLVLALAACGRDANVAPRADYAAAVERLSGFIEHEMADKALPALSVVLVDDQEIVWARGFGYADPVDRVPATAATVYRVGSVSKLFTDIAIMQLVERGEIDLDAPLARYLPEFAPHNPYDRPITLRQLMAHRSGLVREPPVGHYFDDTEPTLTATVASLQGAPVVYEPETRIKYSNAGIAVVGYVLERTQQEPFAQYLARAVLRPLGMDASSFAPDPTITRRLARAYMWTLHGRTFEAPTFQLGMAPAGSMYAPVTDLGRFMSALFAGGQGSAGRVLESETLAAMLRPQYAPPDATTGFGIGFSISALAGHRRIGHGGAIYGFATDLRALPDVKLGAAAATTVDGANTVVSRITAYALRLMLAVREGTPLPEADVTEPVPPALAQRAAGRYRGAGRELEIVTRGDSVYARFERSRVRLRARGDTLVTDGRLGYGIRLLPVARGLIVGSDTLRRLPDHKPAAAPERWRGLIGEYGWDHNVLYIYEDRGRLHALIEWFFIDPLTELGRDVFAFPDDGGLYHGEQLVFHRGPDGQATAVDAAGIRFLRRPVGTAGGATFTIAPVRPVQELRRAALAATPPAESGDFRAPDLVELRALDPTIRYDIRYATTNNFMQAVFYRAPHAFLQRPAAEALVRAHRALAREGYGLLIHDAYRPWYVTKMFWDATPDSLRLFVANPANGSRHNRGAAVDLTLYDPATGRPVTMVGGYDEFSERSYPEYPGGTALQRWHRERLRRAMEREGFTVYAYEWWHFDYGDWARYPILNRTFEEWAGGRPE